MPGRHAHDALLVDTEGHGFQEGAYLNARLDVLVVHGVTHRVGLPREPQRRRVRAGLPRPPPSQSRERLLTPPHTMGRLGIHLRFL